MFLDSYNFVSLNEALGADGIETLRDAYREQSDLASLNDFFSSRPDLSDDQVLESWEDEEELLDPDEPFAQRLFTRAALQKTRMRAALRGFACNENPNFVLRDQDTAWLLAPRVPGADGKRLDPLEESDS